MSAPSARGNSTNSGLVGSLHGRLIFDRRTKVLSSHLMSLIPLHSRILDVGCGDGTIDALIQQQRPDLVIEGIDILVRPNTHIPVQHFDGQVIPHPDQSFDVVIFVDVLHHTEDPIVLLKEAHRVGKHVLIKDHFREGAFAYSTLRLMDWVGNAHHGVVLPYNYWRESEWRSAFEKVGLFPSEVKRSLNLYAAPLSWLFGRKLHFIARCDSSSGAKP